MSTDSPRYRPYPAYRDSGVMWLGEIPAHWRVARIGDVAHSLQTGPFGSQLHADEYITGGIPIINPAHLRGGRIQPDRDCTVDQATWLRLARHELLEGDIIFARRGEMGRCAMVTAVEQGWLCGSGSLRMRPKQDLTDPVFLSWMLSTSGVAEWLALESVGTTMDNLSAKIIGQIPLPIPSFPEQRAINSFLDRETTKLDALIAKKERLLALLAEKRAALISHAVTKGLDPSVSMRDSGVVWLGEIPTHWEVKRLKFATSEPLKYGISESAELNDPTLPRFIRITDIGEDGTLHVDTFRSLPENVALPFLLQSGDLLFARSGATVGKSFMYRESWGRACYAGYLVRARLNGAIAQPEFIAYFATAHSYWSWLSSVFIKATIQNVNAEKYSNLLLPLPPLDEQAQITEFLDREAARFGALSDKVSAAIAKLREYRAALISAAVTGKIDVRGEAAVHE